MPLPACKHEPPSCSKGGCTAILILIRAADAPTRVNERAVGAYRAALAAPPSSSLQGWRSSLRQCRHMAREDRCAVARPASALRPLQDRLQSLSSLGAFGGMAARLRGVARRCRPRWFHGRRHDRESPPARRWRKRGSTETILAGLEAVFRPRTTLSWTLLVSRSTSSSRRVKGAQHRPSTGLLTWPTDRRSQLWMSRTTPPTRRTRSSRVLA